GFGLSRSQLVHRAVAVRAAVLGRAVEVAFLVEDQARKRISAVPRLTSETVEYLLRAGRGDLEHRAHAVSAALPGRAIEVPLLAEDQARNGILAVQGLTTEAVEHLLSLGQRWPRRNKQRGKNSQCQNTTSHILTFSEHDSPPHLNPDFLSCPKTAAIVLPHPCWRQC